MKYFIPYSALAIQRHVRGLQGRNRAERIFFEKKKQEMIALNKNKKQMYYRLQDDYIRSQNLFHRAHAISIQKRYRGYRGKCLVYDMNYTNKVRTIQRAWYDYLAKKHARKLMDTIRNENALTVRVRISILLIQRICRGFIARHQALRVFQSVVSLQKIKWFLMEAKRRRMILQVPKSFRYCMFLFRRRYI